MTLQFALNFRLDTGDDRMAIRVGIHVGPVRIKDDEIYELIRKDKETGYVQRLTKTGV